MKTSLLQRERAAYQPKLPKGLQGAVKVKEGEPTQSVGDQEEIKKMFPNTYGMPLIEFVPRCHPFWWSGSWWTQRNLWYLRRCKEAQSREQALWLPYGSWWSC